MENNKLIGVIVVLAVLLIASVGYIGFQPYNERQAQQQFELFQIGQEQGVEFAVSEIMRQAATCQQVPLRIGNQTINIVALECLQMQETQQQFDAELEEEQAAGE